MMIKANGEYLDYNGELVIEKQAKLFSDLSFVTGDYSYSDSLPVTTKNINILGLETSNKDKIIYSQITADILTEAGELIYHGVLRIDSIIDESINFTFISGNAIWMNVFGNKNIDQLNFSQYEMDVDFYGYGHYRTTSYSYITSRMGATSGIVFPLVDNGTLLNRGYRRIRPDDLHPFIFLKNVMDVIFNQSGLKLTGALRNDYLYDNAIISGNNSSVTQKQIDNRKVLSGLASSQSFTVETTLNLTVGFTSSSPAVTYYNSKNLNFDSTAHSWTADVKMQLRVHGEVFVSVAAGDSVAVTVKQNGATALSFQFAVNATDLVFDGDFFNVSAGDVITVTIQRTAGAAAISATSASVYFEPVFIHHIYPASLIKSSKISDFVGEVFRMFNVVPSYNPLTMEVNAELFKNVKNKTEVDISPYINKIDQYFAEDVTNYSKVNFMKFSESLSDEAKNYNAQNVIPYGADEILINNFYLKQQNDFISLQNFVAPWVYFNSVFGCWLPKMKYITLNQLDITFDTGGGVYTVVTQPFIISSTINNPDVAGTARFVNSDPSTGVTTGEGLTIIRVKTGVNNYNYDWPTTYASPETAPFGSNSDTIFTTNAKGTLQAMNFDADSDENVILTYLPNISVNSFSNFDGIWFGTDWDGSHQSVYYNNFDFAYFLPPPNMSLQLTHAWGLPNGFTGIDATQNYYTEVTSMLNDPVKYIVTAYIPEKIFYKLDPINPVRIKFGPHNSLCYLNRITGYKDSKTPCEIELIKF